MTNSLGKDSEGAREPLARVRSAVSRRLGVNARALAAFRIALGALLVADLLTRARHLRAFYTDEGVLPRSVLAKSFPTYPKVSIHVLSGDLWFQALLFFVAGVVAFSLLVGYRTRLATVLSFILLVSLHARNPLALNGGDLTLRVFLLIGIFLPLGERWSVDAVRRTHEARSRIVSVASATVLLHVVLIYTTNAIFKLRGDAWPGGEAVGYSLNIQRYTVLLGNYLVDFPELLTAVTWFWLALLVGSSTLVLLTGWRRVALVLCFVGAHLGMAFTLRLGLFPFISIAVLIPFLPETVWDIAEERMEEVASTLRERVGSVFEEREPRGHSLRRLGGRIIPVLVGVFLVASVAWQGVVLGYVGMPDPLEGNVERADHRWSMFAPDPTSDDGWYAVDVQVVTSEGETETVDGFGREGIDIEDPGDSSRTYPTDMWHRYLSKVDDDERMHPSLTEYFCHRLDGRYEAVSSVDIDYYRRPVYVGGTGEATRHELVERECP